MPDESYPSQKISRHERRRLQREQEKYNPYSPAERAAIESSKEIIRKRARKQGVKGSREEKLLWRAHDFIPVDESLPPLSAETAEKAVSNFRDTVALMEKSENGHFQDTVRFFDEHHDEIILVMDVEKPLSARDRAAFMGVRFHIDPDMGTYSWLLDIDPQHMAISPPFYSAISLVHEKQHIEDFMEAQKELPDSTTLTERLDRHKVRLLLDVIYMADEARGWGMQCDAIITEYGLGFEASLPPALLKFAADYASIGAKMDSNPWKEYVAKNIFGLDDFKA